MLMLSVILALLLGWCTGGRLSRFEEADLRLLPLPVLAFACQQAMNALAGRISLPFEAWAWLPLLLSYGLIFLFLWQNRHLKKTCLLVGAGRACNLAVIAANGWRMPVASRAAALLSEQGAAALLARELPAVRYHLRTPPFWDGLPGSYLQAFGMVKWYNSELEAAWRNERKGYMGLGYD